MAQPVIQTSFHAGEWAPDLNARVDLSKYHSAAALLENFFVDYRGGASTRTGTRWDLQAFKSNTAVRLIPFQASFTVNYILEFGDGYIRFHTNGGPILEASFAISGATQANPCVLTITSNNYAIGDWIFVNNVVGMTQLNNKYFQVLNVSGASVTIGKILDGSNVNSTAFTAYSSGGIAQRVYTLTSPYAAADLALIKYAQNVNTLTLCHPNYVPYILTVITATNWTITPIVFGTTVATPGGIGSTTTFSSGSANYSYVVTAVDVNGQESGPSAATTLSAKQDEATTRGTNQVTWTAVSGAAFYNVYKAKTAITTAIPAGAAFGFAGFTTGTAFNDVNIEPDFSSTPPIAANPFSGASVISTTITAAGAYTTCPSCSFAASAGATATGQPFLGYTSLSFSAGSSLGFAPLDKIFYPGGIVLVVDTVNGSGSVLSFKPLGFPGTSNGFVTGVVPSNPIAYTSTSGAGHGALTINVNWGVSGITLFSGGSGYVTAPAITFTGSGGATATSTLGAATANNPSVPSYFQQRLVLAASINNPQGFDMSQPGNFFNFNINIPVQDDDAISGTISSLQLNTIKSMTPMPGGLITLGDKQAWLINGGGQGVPITPSDANANAQAYNGASDLAPIPVNFDLLYVQSKGSIVRDLAFNFYTNIYTGTDISVLSSHLFFGFTILAWAYAEEPFKTIYAVRSDGALLTLTYLKEQEIVGWAHSTTSGFYKSVATITETLSSGVSVDATYVVVARTVNGNNVQYIERVADRYLSTGVTFAWCVDAGLQYIGTPISTVTGLDHLIGATVTGLADGNVIPPTVVAADGSITISPAAAVITVGLGYTCKLQTLAIDVGEPTAQGKRKKIPAVVLRCKDSLGLQVGTTFNTLVPMKDLIIGNVGTETNQVVNGLVTGDARTITDPNWTVPGQICVQQSSPLPATILGFIPEIIVGDTAK